MSGRQLTYEWVPQRKEEREIIRKREVDIIEESSNGLGWLKDNLVLTSVLQAGVPHTRSGCPGPLGDLCRRIQETRHQEGSKIVQKKCKEIVLN